VRLGGIYALERIARDSPRDHWTIMEVLTAYVRENACWIEPSLLKDVLPEGSHELGNLPTDIQPILTVIGRRVRFGDRPEPARLDLRGTDLRGADLWGAQLERASLMNAYLEGAHLNGAHLEKAEDITQEQVYSAVEHGEGAFLPPD
jgi:hypothetical protein